MSRLDKIYAEKDSGAYLGDAHRPRGDGKHVCQEQVGSGHVDEALVTVLVPGKLLPLKCCHIAGLRWD